eukprot:2123497-Prymnesium_polylepis.1
MHSPAKGSGTRCRGLCRGMYSPATGSDMCCRGVCTVEVEQSQGCESVRVDLLYYIQERAC